MVDDMAFINQGIGPGSGLGPRPPTTNPAPLKGPGFADVLARKQQLGPPTVPGTPLKLSAHAAQRLSSRNIQLDAGDWERISKGVEKAAAKGAKEALILTEKAAMVVSVKNRTVITAVDPANLKDNVFTNIDSAVIV